MFSEQEYLERFGTFFRSADFSSSYKPVFLKSIMDLADYQEGNNRLVGTQWLKRNNGELQVELDFLAVRFAKYYWDMYYKFRLRQSHNPSDVNIHKFFKDPDKNSLEPPTLQDLADEKHRELRLNVIRKSIKPEVLIKLNKDLALYRIVKAKNHILFDYDIVPFLRRYKGILNPGINYVLTRYLEKINFSPRIAEKVRGVPPRTQLKPEEKAMLRRFHKACFYCYGMFENYHIDHVVPFDYLFSTELFNSVPACEECNSKKSNKLPTEDIFVRVIERNRGLSMPKEYEETWYHNLYRKCIVEYHGSREYFRPRSL